LLSEEERQDAPPDWVQEAAAGEKDVDSTLEEEPTIEAIKPDAQDVEMPDWLVEDEKIESPDVLIEASSLIEEVEQVDRPILGDTQPTRIAPPEPAAEEFIKEIEHEDKTPTTETPTEDVVPELDESEAGFAWLESLAVKQGAEEALLLSEEERLDKPPEWIQQAAKEATAEEVIQVPPDEAEITDTPILEDELSAPEDDADKPSLDVVEEAKPGVIEEDEAFAWLEGLAARQGVDEAMLLEPEERTETPPDWVSQTPIEEPPTKELPPESDPETIISDEGIAAVQPEPTAMEPDIDEPAGVDEDLPELPSWIDEPGSSSTEPLDWELPQVQIDINQGSLADFEKLPGVGFILAQRIINHRDNRSKIEYISKKRPMPNWNQKIRQPGSPPGAMRICRRNWPPPEMLWPMVR